MVGIKLALRRRRKLPFRRSFELGGTSCVRSLSSGIPSAARSCSFRLLLAATDAGYATNCFAMDGGASAPQSGMNNILTKLSLYIESTDMHISQVGQERVMFYFILLVQEFKFSAAPTPRTLLN